MKPARSEYSQDTFFKTYGLKFEDILTGRIPPLD